MRPTKPPSITKGPEPDPKVLYPEPPPLDPYPSGPVTHVNYWAISVFSSRMNGVNFIALLTGAIPLMASMLALPEVMAVIPPRFMLSFIALTACVNLYLRQKTVRPTAFIAPGTTIPVLVPKIDPPTPVLTD